MERILKKVDRGNQVRQGTGRVSKEVPRKYESSCELATFVRSYITCTGICNVNEMPVTCWQSATLVSRRLNRGTRHYPSLPRSVRLLSMHGNMTTTKETNLKSRRNKNRLC
jgi:hypothetical protein